MQELLVLITFLLALLVLGRYVWQLFQKPQAGCAKGCGTCKPLEIPPHDYN